MDSSSDKQAITIGIFGSNGKTSTASLLNSMFYDAGMSVNILNDENFVVSDKKMANIEIHNKLKKMTNNDIIIIEITKEFLKNDILEGIKFDILVHTHISYGSYEYSMEGISKINSIINSSSEAKSVILNTDDSKWKDIIINLENIYLITYGLGSKATVTASSIESGKNIKFCYCLQRSISNYYNGFTVPMELPLGIKAPGQYNVYNGLAAITAALISGVGADIIQSSLNKVLIQNTGIKILYENGFEVIDNMCDTVLSFESGFETIQNLNYDNIQLVFNLCSKNSHDINSKILETIGTWSMILNIKKIYYLESGGDVPAQKIKKFLNNLLKNSRTEIAKIEGKSVDVAGIISSLREDDTLLVFCSSDLSQLRECIIETLDKLILGEL